MNELSFINDKPWPCSGISRNIARWYSLYLNFSKFISFQWMILTFFEFFEIYIPSMSSSLLLKIIIIWNLCYILDNEKKNNSRGTNTLNFQLDSDSVLMEEVLLKMVEYLKSLVIINFIGNVLSGSQSALPAKSFHLNLMSIINYTLHADVWNMKQYFCEV